MPFDLNTTISKPIHPLDSTKAFSKLKGAALNLDDYQWRSESSLERPKVFRTINDQTTADQALNWAKSSEGLIWTGDFQNAKQLLRAMSKRLISQRQLSQLRQKPILERFHIHRLHQSQRLKVLSKLLVPVDASYQIPLSRAPQVKQALEHAIGTNTHGLSYLMSLREILGFIGAYEWYKNGLEFDERYFAKSPLNKIHPSYGVFSPSRAEYLSLVHRAPLSPNAISGTAFDIGVGTGILSAMLIQRGVPKVVATDAQDRAIACAVENLSRLGLMERVSVLQCDLFPPGKADLVVCNPPWLPGKVRTSIESAIYDENSQMLKGFLKGLRDHLQPNGEAWLIMSDLAERLGLRAQGELQAWVSQSGLEVIEILHTKPTHPKTQDPLDPLFEARSQEITSLWRLQPMPTTSA